MVLQWFRSEGRIIIATSVFRIGIDITDIRLIVYIGWPRILLDYAQESGRAGRDRLKSEAVIIIRESQFAEPGEALVDRLVNNFVKGQRCKREILDGYLDSRKDRVGYDDVEVPCEVYRKKLQIRGPIEKPRVEDSRIRQDSQETTVFGGNSTEEEEEEEKDKDKAELAAAQSERRAIL